MYSFVCRFQKWCLEVRKWLKKTRIRDILRAHQFALVFVYLKTPTAPLRTPSTRSFFASLLPHVRCFTQSHPSLRRFQQFLPNSTVSTQIPPSPRTTDPNLIMNIYSKTTAFQALTCTNLATVHLDTSNVQYFCSNPIYSVQHTFSHVPHIAHTTLNIKRTRLIFGLVRVKFVGKHRYALISHDVFAPLTPKHTNPPLDEASDVESEARSAWTMKVIRKYY